MTPSMNASMRTARLVLLNKCFMVSAIYALEDGGVDAAARIQSSIAGPIKLRNTLPPLASNDLFDGVASISVIESQIPTVFDMTIPRGLGRAVVKVINKTPGWLRYKGVVFECALSRPFDRREEPNLILRALGPRQIAHSIETTAEQTTPDTV